MLKGAIIGTGFWANYQIPAWQELPGVTINAAYNRTLTKAEIVADKFNIQRVYDDVEELLEKEKPDFVDIITDVDTHARFTIMDAKKKINVICQKPMAASMEEALEMEQACRENGVELFIHENFRWQLPIRKLKETLDSGVVGAPFKARVSFCSAFPVFENQPFLKELDHFIITDIGSHVLDICRFLFGEVDQLFCVTQRMNPTIKGEDVANVLMQMKSGLHCYAEMSYASIMEKEAFPQTLVFIECEKGSLHLTNDFELRIIKPGGVASLTVEPVIYSWADPAYAVVHSSIVDCNKNILRGMQGGDAETTGADNLRTTALVWAAYESAKGKKSVSIEC